MSLVSTRRHLKTSTYRKWFPKLAEIASLHHCHVEVTPSHYTVSLLVFNRTSYSSILEGELKPLYRLKGRTYSISDTEVARDPLSTSPPSLQNSTVSPAPQSRPGGALLNSTHASVHRAS